MSLLTAPRRARGARPTILATLLAVLATPLALGVAAPAQAASAGLVITEAFGANSATNLYNQDFVEIHNPTASPISLVGKSVQYRSATGTGAPSGVQALSGSIPAGGYFLVGMASTAGGTSLPMSPDVTAGGINMAAGAGTLIIANKTTALTIAELPVGNTVTSNPTNVIDVFGYGTSNTFEGAVRTGTPSNTTTAKRIQPDTDNNLADFAASSVASPPSPTACDCVAPATLKITEVYADGGVSGSTIDHDFVELQNISGGSLSMSGLTLQYRAPGDTGAASVVATLTGSMAAGTFDVVQLAGTVGNGVPLSSPEYTSGDDLSAAGGTLFIAKSTSAYNPGTGAVITDQYRGDLVGWGTSNVFETTAADASDLSPTVSIQRDNGGVDSEVNSADFSPATPSPNAQPAVPVRTIPEIQGTGPTTPLNNANVSTSGVVTASYPNATGGLNGFYLQTPGYDPANDLTPNASDGVFVFTGSSITFPTPAVGKHVTISSGKVSEFSGMTELTVTNAASLTVRDATVPEAVTSGTVLPGTDCTISGATTDCLSGAALEAEREKHEGEAFQPTSPYTISDSYDGTPWTQSGSFGFAMQGELGLSANDEFPLFAPTEMANPRLEPAKLAARVAYNEAHMITLDDAANIDYSSNANEDTAMPWLTGPDVTARIGANVSFAQPVILDRRNSFWRLQPQSKVTGNGAAQGITIEQDRPAAPDAVTGNLKLATFNMLNYFVHTGEDWVANGGDEEDGANRSCSYFTDRDNVRITNDECLWDDPRIDPPLPAGTRAIGPRGAADAVNLTRQEDKEVAAINTMAADIMTLEEVENPVKLGYSDRDAALKRLVIALNTDWGIKHSEDTVADPRWAFAVTPRKQSLPTVAEQDAIRSAFIYNPRTVETQGASQVLATSPAFRNAREPLAQAFKRLGGSRDDAFILIVNHFKSKGSSTETGDNIDLGDGAGAFNGDRRRQAAALDAFAKQLSDQKQIEPVFLFGDFNAYSNEDPVVDLEEDGWHELAPDNGLKSYSFGGLAGTLDHAFANDAAHDLVQGSTVWPINANEPVFYEYSRYNANFTNVYGVNPFRSSDHNPEIIGINAPLTPPPAAVDTVQVLASNDFHGRLLDDPASASAGAASMAGAVKELRAENEDTIFSMAGDIIGASTFESFIAKDKPTIDALNEAGLEVSAAGNHEFDRGYRDLLERVMDPTDAEGGVDWEYLAANVRLDDEHGAQSGDYALASAARDNSNGATWWKELPNGKTVGFVGAVTEDLPSLVSPDSLAELEITDIVTEVNTSAAELKAPGGCGADACDVVVLLVHEGAASPALSASTDPGTTFGHIVTETSPAVDAIVSGHTHLSYNHKVEVPAWVTEGRAVTMRPVVSAGQYGSYLNQLEFEFEQGSDTLLNIRQHVLAAKDYAADPATQAIVDDAVADAAVAGAVALGEVDGQFLRARRNDPAAGTVENRGGESTLGNLVAEIQRWKTGADLGVMNPGGLRTDLDVNNDGTVTYREAADVQPFANELETVELTGSQIKLLLEQQWQRDPEGNIPSRPFLRLGTSKGFSFTEDASRTEGDRITGMFLDGTEIDPAATYTVSATNFLISGGDNFRALTQGTNVQDTGFTDLQATVDYLAANAPVGGTPLPVDFGQHGVGATVPAGPFVAGDTVQIPLNSLSMTGATDPAETLVTLSYDGVDLDTAPVSAALPTQPFDTAGTATLSFTMPVTTGGNVWFKLTGATGTVAWLPIQAIDDRVDSTVSAPAVSVAYDEPGSVVATVTPTGATGTVRFSEGGTTLGTVALTDGTAAYDFDAGDLPVGDHTLTLSYSGDGTTRPSTSTVVVTITKVDSVVTAPAVSWTIGQAGTIVATVTPTGSNGTVKVFNGPLEIGSGTLATDAGATTTTISIPADALAVGSYTLTLAYSGDGTTKTAEGTVSVTVDKATGTVTGTAADITDGQPGSVVATVTPTGATGTVELYDGATKLGEGTLATSAGATTTTIPVAADALAVGSHELTLKYLGDANTASDEGTVTVKVLAVSIVSAPAVSVAYDQAGSVVATVTPNATGTVTFAEGATTLDTVTLTGSSTATYDFVANSLSIGDHTLTLSYSGDATTRPSTSTVVVTITKVDSVVTAPAASWTVGTAGSVVATVTPTGATGTVELYDGATKLGEGTLATSAGATTTTIPVAADALAAGPHTLTLKYLGDGTTKTAEGTVSVTVDKATGTVTGTASAITVGTAGSVVATVTPTGATGIVELYDGTTKLGQGTLATDAGATTTTIPVAAGALAVGPHELTLKYLGDSSTTTDEGTVTVNVVTTTSTVTGTAADITWGQAGSVVATVAPGDATGIVELYDGPTKLAEGTVSGGTATIAIAARSLSVGSHELTLKYLGDTNHAADDGTVSVTVLKATSTVTGTAAGITWGQAGSVAVSLAPAGATGTVELYDGPTKLAEGTISGGTATIALAAKSLSVGAHALTLKYPGDTNHEPDEGPVSVTVTKAATTTTATATPASVVQDSGTSAIAVAVTASGFVPTGSVSAWQGATELATATLVNGQASLTVGPFATTGAKPIEVRYAGDGNATASTTTVTVTVTAKPAPQPIATTVSGTTTPITYGAAGSVTIAVAPSAATGQVELLNGTTSLGTATLAGGRATIGVPAKALEVGTHTLVVRYLGSSTHNASQSTVPVTVAKAKPTVKVKDAKGKAGKKTKVVTHVSAIGYDVTGKVKLVARLIGSKKKVTDTVTLKDGKAVSKLVLPKAGKYKLTVVYQGDAHTLTGQDRATLTAR